MSRQSELFPGGAPTVPADAPLAERMRPRSLAEFRGQPHLLGPGRLLRAMANRGRIDSLVLWGPPGCGKTTLARLLADRHEGPVARFSAVMHGVRELRALVADARREIARRGPPTLIVVDEIHRFNTAQQDAFLPHVEDGTIALLGMTTENPSFELVPPLLSRVRVVLLEPLGTADIEAIIDAALRDPDRGVRVRLTDDARRALTAGAHGDARIALGTLEAAAHLAGARPDVSVDVSLLREAAQHHALPHDKAGDAHYDLLSAFIKSMRGSDPDAAVYYLMRLLEAGEDPLVVARRLVVLAAEDVGLAAPDALAVAIAAKDAVQFVGLPEGRIPLAMATIHLACAPKSNAAYAAMQAAAEVVRQTGALPVPLHLRNVPTALARALGHGRGYRYPHELPDALSAQPHLPPELGDEHFYEPTGRGWEGARRADLAAARERRRGGRHAPDGSNGRATEIDRLGPPSRGPETRNREDPSDS
jgi:putative ATPase